jgi:hypothetical protein
MPRPPASLRDLDFETPVPVPATAPIEDLSGYLEEAKAILAAGSTETWEPPDLGPEAEALRWFPNPNEVKP